MVGVVGSSPIAPTIRFNGLPLRQPFFLAAPAASLARFVAQPLDLQYNIDLVSGAWSSSYAPLRPQFERHGYDTANAFGVELEQATSSHATFREKVRLVRTFFSS